MLIVLPAALTENLKNIRYISILWNEIVTDFTDKLVLWYTGWAKKVNPKYSTHNFVKYWPILKILSALQSPENLQCSSHSATPQMCRYTTLWNVCQKTSVFCAMWRSEWLIHRNMYSMKTVEYLMLKQKKMTLT